MSLKRSKSYVWPTVLQGKSVLGDSTTTGCFATVPGELNSLSFALANYSVNKVGLRPCKPSACSGPTHPKLSSANLRLAADQCTASKIGSASVNAPSCSAFCPANRSTNTSTGKRSYVLNTIAEEGDLVDENYKDCTSSFL